MGFISRDRLDVTIDMGESTALHSIGADFMQVVGPEVFLPTEVIISVSEDGKNFTELSRQTHKVVKSDAVVFKNYAWNGEAKGRYIRYQARAGEEFGGWVFTDEIVVE
jgi:hexosaminidase